MKHNVLIVGLLVLCLVNTALANMSLPEPGEDSLEPIVVDLEGLGDCTWARFFDDYCGILDPVINPVIDWWESRVGLICIGCVEG